MKNKLLMVVLAAVFLVLAMAAPALDASIDSNSLGSAKLGFSTKTVAICEYKEDSVYCHDEVVVSCGDEEYVLPKSEKAVSCGSATLEVPKITAFAVFDKEWKDPRNA